MRGSHHVVLTLVRLELPLLGARRRRDQDLLRRILPHLRLADGARGVRRVLRLGRDLRHRRQAGPGPRRRPDHAQGHVGRRRLPQTHHLQGLPLRREVGRTHAVRPRAVRAEEWQGGQCGLGGARRDDQQGGGRGVEV